MPKHKQPASLGHRYHYVGKEFSYVRPETGSYGCFQRKKAVDFPEKPKTQIFVSELTRVFGKCQCILTFF